MNRIFSFSLLVFFCCSLVFSEGVRAADSYYINPVALVVNNPGREILSFPMEKPVEYKIFTLTAPPRLVIDFPYGLYRGEKKKSMEKSRFVRAVRSAHHKEPSPKTRIVVDLQPQKGMKHQLFFNEEKKALQLILTAEGAASPAKEKVKAEVLPPKAKESRAKKSVEKPPVLTEGKDRVPQLTARKEAAQIRSISFDAPKLGEERVRFRLSGFYPPKISTKEENMPQVICDFADADLAKNVERQMITGGNLVQRIFTRKTARGVEVVLELARGKDFDLQQIFFRDGNLFVLVVREFAANETLQ